jgi:hypothetical protein
MTETEANVLITLSPPAGDDPKPFHLRALGGRRGSSLSVQINRMVAKGWVARTRIGGILRPVFSYQITLGGALALANHRACATALENCRFGQVIAKPPGRVEGENYCASCDRSTPRDFCPKCGAPFDD